MKQKTITRLSLLVIFLFIAGILYASIGGITGRTLKSTTSGCSCHGGAFTPDVTVTIAGPDTVIKSQSAQYTLTVTKASKTGAGLDIATRRGTLSPVSGNIHLSNGEITHNNNLPMTGGTVTVTFSYTAPATTGPDTLWATGLATNSNNSESGDDWNWAPSKRVIVREPLGIISNSTVTGYSLSQNYPNPFNPSTTISFEIPKKDFVKISVYDINGKIAETLMNKEMLPGKHNISWSPKSFSSGIYIYKLEAGEYAETKTMILIK